MSIGSARLDHAGRPDGVLNADALRSDARRQALGLLALLSPGLFLVFAVIIVPIGWLFWLSLFDETGQLSLANYARFFEQALESVRDLPGITSAAFVSQLPLSGDYEVYGIEFEAYPGQAEAAFRYARKAVVPAAGHMMQRHQPAALAQLLLEFLS